MILRYLTLRRRDVGCKQGFLAKLHVSGFLRVLAVLLITFSELVDSSFKNKFVFVSNIVYKIICHITY